MRVSLLQSELLWEDKAGNLSHFAAQIDALVERGEDIDLLVLPEMFTTGFSMNAAALAEAPDGESVAWMAAQAQRLNAAVVGSLIITENGRYYNRLIFMHPDGRAEHYDKKHLFSMADEHAHYSPGHRRLLVEYRGWRILPLVCYDLRFPVWSRNTDDYDLALYVANWPQRRAEHWKLLLQARAVENQAFVVGVNRVGKDGKGHDYAGDSSVVAPDGELLFRQSHTQAYPTLLLEKERLREVRSRMPFLKDRDLNWTWV